MTEISRPIFVCFLCKNTVTFIYLPDISNILHFNFTRLNVSNLFSKRITRIVSKFSLYLRENKLYRDTIYNLCTFESSGSYIARRSKLSYLFITQAISESIKIMRMGVL